MKSTIFTLTLILFLIHSFPVSGQSVSYTYDASGNRIARSVILPAAKSGVKTKSVGTIEGTEDIQEPFADMINGRQIKIHPNPTRGHLAVEITGTGEEDVQITVFAQGGELLSEIKTTSGTSQVDLSSYPAGVYILYLSINGKTEHYQIIKQ